MEWTIEKLAKHYKLAYIGDPELVLHHVCGLSPVIHNSVLYITQAGDLSSLEGRRDILILARPEHGDERYNMLLTEDPLALHVKIAELLNPPLKTSQRVHSTAIIGEGVEIAENVTIDANVVIYDGVTIGSGTVIRAGVVIMDDCDIGENCLIYPNVTLREHTTIGHRVILHAGCVIGSDGFGFFERDGKHQKIPQVGYVQIEDDVEIGANCTIDRSRFYCTLIRRGTKLDNLVHVAHNCEVGEDSLLTAQVGLAGSVITGRHTVMGGQSGIVDQVRVGDNVTVYAKGLVTKNIKDNEIVGGIPARGAFKWKRSQALIQMLESMLKRLKKLEERQGE